ncbi:MAG: H-NS histone family protein [Rhodobacteraceae bacterium]|jgi:DNA-binding protein H-NS|nr:H-NS histone family protein [Paracoccaceae bacterium]
MSIDLHSMSRADLEKLRGDIDKALASLESRKLAEARKAAEDAVRALGFSLDEVLGGGAAPKTRGRKAAKSGEAKYRNPANPSQTWTGRGRQPGWIKDGLKAGKSMGDFSI